MSYTATMSPAGLFASQFIAERPRPHTQVRNRVKHALRRFIRAFGAMGLALEGAYPPSGRAR
jgi:hypothetical protein